MGSLRLLKLLGVSPPSDDDGFRGPCGMTGNGTTRPSESFENACVGDEGVATSAFGAVGRVFEKFDFWGGRRTAGLYRIEGFASNGRPARGIGTHFDAPRSDVNCNKY